MEIFKIEKRLSRSTSSILSLGPILSALSPTVFTVEGDSLPSESTETSTQDAPDPAAPSGFMSLSMWQGGSQSQSLPSLQATSLSRDDTSRFEDISWNINSPSFYRSNCYSFISGGLRALLMLAGSESTWSIDSLVHPQPLTLYMDNYSIAPVQNNPSPHTPQSQIGDNITLHTKDDSQHSLCLPPLSNLDSS